MFDNPYAFIRWIVILSAVALLIYRFQVLQIIFDILTRRKTKQEEDIQQKVDNLLNKREKK